MRLLAFAPMAAMFVGCGGHVVSTPIADAGGDQGSEVSVLPHAPSKHRAAKLACATPPLPAEPDLARHSFGPSAMFECKKHAECTARANGRCIAFDTIPPTERGGTRCLYSACNDDRECGNVCECGAVVNACLPGNCRLDSDCASGFCSPSFDLCSHEVTGYFCHTASDECIDDRDCDATHFMTHCEADLSGHWTCPRAACGA